MQKRLFTPVQVGPFTLKHRVVMPPMSRLRAQWLSGSNWAAARPVRPKHFLRLRSSRLHRLPDPRNKFKKLITNRRTYEDSTGDIDRGV
jgi:hypothetical protein